MIDILLSLPLLRLLLAALQALHELLRPFTIRHATPLYAIRCHCYAACAKAGSICVVTPGHAIAWLTYWLLRHWGLVISRWPSLRWLRCHGHYVGCRALRHKT